MIIKKLFSIAVATLSMCALSGSLGAAPQISWIDDPNSDGMPDGTTKYEINNMRVSWADDNQVTVTVYTAFAGEAFYNKDRPRKSIGYGDLLIATDTSSFTKGSTTSEGTNWADNGTKWDYAFMIDKRNDYEGRRHKGGDRSHTGWLVEYQDKSSDKKNESDEWTSRAGKDDEIVTTEWNGQSIKNYGSWAVNSSEDYLSFSFNIANLGLSDPTQLAFRWAMTCANDIISGVARRTTNEVAEPAIAALLMSGLGLIGFSRRRRQMAAIHS